MNPVESVPFPDHPRALREEARRRGQHDLLRDA